MIFPDAPQRPIALLTILVVALISTRGANLALKLQLPIMGAIALSLVALIYGVVTADPVRPETAELVTESFWSVFAVFFPAVTGIMAGVSLSGDLERPERSIPRGTIAAVAAGFAVYLGAVLVLGAAAGREALIMDNLIWFRLAGGVAFLVFAGITGAIFSSAVGSVLGAPRTLQAMADDRVLPGVVGRSIGRISGPGVPLLITLAVALTGVALGNLDAVAPALTMFFLTTYGVVNLVAGVERLAGDPSFRPAWNVPWWASIGGAAACFWVMYLINPIALAIAVTFEVAVYLGMRRRAMVAPWGDLRRGALISLVRTSVLQLRRLPTDPRNWRPNILLFSGTVQKRRLLVRYGNWLVQNRGILTVVDLIIGDVAERGEEAKRRGDDLNQELDRLGVPAFGEVNVVQEFVSGATAIAQANGIAGIETNTVMFGWSAKPPRRASVLAAIEGLSEVGISSVICKPIPLEPANRRRVIHVWWGGLQQNGDLLVLFAHLISQNPDWRGARIEVKNIATSEMMRDRSLALLDTVIEAARVKATPHVILKGPDQTVQEIITAESRTADLVLMGLRDVPAGTEAEYANRLDALVEHLPTTLLIRSAGEFRGKLLGEETVTGVDRSRGAGLAGA